MLFLLTISVSIVARRRQYPLCSYQFHIFYSVDIFVALDGQIAIIAYVSTGIKGTDDGSW